MGHEAYDDAGAQTTTTSTAVVGGLVGALEEEEVVEEVGDRGGGGCGGNYGAINFRPAPLKETPPHNRRMQAPIAQTASPSVFLVAHTS